MDFKIYINKEYYFNIYNNYYARLKRPALFVFSSIAKSLSQIGAVFLIARYVNPSDLGLWSFLYLFIGYSAILNLGTVSGLNRELPFYLGKGDIEKANRLAATALFISTIISLLSICVGFSLFLVYLKISVKLSFSILILSLLIAITFYENYFLATYRSSNSFRQLSILQFFISILNILSLALIYYYNYWGLLSKTLLVELLFVIILYWRRPIRVKLKWDKQSFIDLLKVGFPIYILAYIQALSVSFDKILILKLTDTTQLGLYTFSYYSFFAFSLISVSISNYIYPKFTYKYGETNNKSVFWNYNKKISIILLVMCSLIGLIMYFLLPFVFELFFPNYIESLKASQIFIFAGIFMCSTIGANILLSLKVWKYIVLYNIILSVLLIVCPLIFSFLIINKLIAISLGLCLAYLINFIYVNILVKLATKTNI